MSTIASINALEVIDSRGNPTVWAKVTTDSGHSGVAAVPSGASTGEYEALELRDKDPKRYGGKGVLTAVANINGMIADSLEGMAVNDQLAVDRCMLDLDGTPNKAKLGANSMLAVSMAVANASANAAGIPLYRAMSAEGPYQMPVPMMNIINGGAHASNNVDLQEFMILPVGAPSFAEAIRYGAEIFHALKSVLSAQGAVTAVGDEGGFAPDLPSNKAALDMIEKAVSQAGFSLGDEILLGLDVASSEFYVDGKYELASENLSLSSSEFSDMLERVGGGLPDRFNRGWYGSK